MKTLTFDWGKERAQRLAESIKNNVAVPAISAYVSILGGERNRAAVMITLAFDPRKSWANGILENSRYLRMIFEHTGRLSSHSGGGGLPKFRAVRLAPDQVVAYLNNWITRHDLP